MYDRLGSQLQQAPLLINGRNNCLVWKASTSSMFAVHSLYMLLDADLGLKINVLDLAWKNVAPHKVQFFGWLPWMGRIKTTDLLMRLLLIF